METLVETASNCLALLERCTPRSKSFALALTPEERARYVAEGKITLPPPQTPARRYQSADRVQRAAIVTQLIARYEGLTNPPHGTLARMCREAGCSYVAASRRIQKKRQALRRACA